MNGVIDLAHRNRKENQEHCDEHEIEQQHRDASSTFKPTFNPRLFLHANFSAQYKRPVPRKAPQLTRLNPQSGWPNDPPHSRSSAPGARRPAEALPSVNVQRGSPARLIAGLLFT
jgi:hypothetical protein